MWPRREAAAAAPPRLTALLARLLQAVQLRQVGGTRRVRLIDLRAGMAGGARGSGGSGGDGGSRPAAAWGSLGERCARHPGRGMRFQRVPGAQTSANGAPSPHGPGV